MTDILIIDDEPALRRIMVIVLNRAGLTTCEASDGDEGIARFRSDTPRMIITDMTMPSRGGLSVIAEIRALDRDIPILVISGGDDSELMQQARAGGATDALGKPFKPQQLLEKVRMYLGEGV
jgi:CheY-like chemotaxis protein